jgi:hypothetical protein
MDEEEIWRIREEDVYPKLFGAKSRGIFTLDDKVFRQFGQETFDPLWFFLGVWEFAPTEARPCWMYVTSGLSNPWNWDDESNTASDPTTDVMSGFGMEFLFATPQQGDWAIRYLQTLLAYDILLYCDCFPDRGPIGPGNRVSFNAPLNRDPECALRGAIVSRADAFPSGFVLPSGQVEFFTVTGVADDEISFARENSTNILIERLVAAGAYPVTNPERAPLRFSES